MAIQIIGNGGVIADVDGTTYRALRVTARPIDYGALGYYRLSMQSNSAGAVMAVSLALNSEIYQWRWPDATRFGAVYEVWISACPNVAASTAALAAFRMTVARSWTAAGSGGIRATLTSPNGKLRASMGASLVNDAGIANTGALTAGTKTLDAQDIGAVAFGIGTGAITSIALQWVPKTMLFAATDTMSHPLVCAQNEGFVVRNGGVAFPAGATWAFAVDVGWAEVAAF